MIFLMSNPNLKNMVKSLLETYENEPSYNDFYTMYKILDEVIDDVHQGSVNVGEVKITINNNQSSTEDDADTGVKSISPMKKKQWSQHIRERGNYTCAKCGKLDEQYCQAHHIFPIARYPELAYDRGNGVVLCQHCHSEYHREYLGRESPYTLMYYLQVVEEG